MKRKKISEASHNLATAWRIICPVLWDACSTDQDRETIDVVKDYIQQFQDFDRSSFKFRYPIDKQFHRTLDREQRIDLPNLKKRMDELSQFFDAVEAQLNQLQEWKAEERQLNEDMMYDIPGEDY